MKIPERLQTHVHLKLKTSTLDRLHAQSDATGESVAAIIARIVEREVEGQGGQSVMGTVGER